MAKVKRHRKRGSEGVLANVKAQRGLDRKHHFAAGGTLIEWRGGPCTVTKNRKAWENKRLARQKVRI